MGLLIDIVIGFVVLSVTSGLGILAYGNFARRSLGTPSYASEVVAGSTDLDILVEPMLAAHQDRSGLRLLDDNLDAFTARAQAARSAGRSLDLQYYYWMDDLTGTLLAKEVLEAADRGVRVRMLIDDINLRGRDANYLAFDAHRNIEVRVFNPSWNRVGALQRGLELIFRAHSSTRRMHNKAWIADGRVAIVGGRNIGDSYFDASKVMNFRDLDVLCIGPCVAEGERSFDLFWNSDCVNPIRQLPAFANVDLPALRKTFGRVWEMPEAEPYRKALAEGNAAQGLLARTPMRWCDRARIVSDPPAKSRGAKRHRWLYKEILPLVTSARRSLEISSPYFIPGPEGVRQLTSLTKAGATVTVLTNSLAATDVAAVHGAYAPYRRPLIEGGVHLHELKPEARRSRMSLFGSSGASLHTKSFTVDGEQGFVGSFNFDPRSVSLNTEMGVIFRDANLVADVSRVFRQELDLSASYSVGLDRGKMVWRDRHDGADRFWRHEPQASLWRRFVARLVRFLPIESQL